MGPHTAARSAPSPPESPSRSLPASSGPSALVRATAAGSSTKAAAQRSVSWAMPRRGSGSASARSISASTIASDWRGSWRPVSPTGCWRSGRSTRRRRRSARGVGGRVAGRRFGRGAELASVGSIRPVRMSCPSPNCCGSPRCAEPEPAPGAARPLPPRRGLVVVEAGAREVASSRAGAVSTSPSCSCTRSSMKVGSTTQIRRRNRVRARARTHIARCGRGRAHRR